MRLLALACLALLAVAALAAPASADDAVRADAASAAARTALAEAEILVVEADALVGRLRSRRIELEGRLDDARATLARLGGPKPGHSARPARLTARHGDDGTGMGAAADAAGEVTDLEHALAHLDVALRRASEGLDEATRAAAEHAEAVDAAEADAAGAALRATWEAGTPGASGKLWPTEGEKSSAFGYRSHPLGGQRRLHAGLDIAAPSGAPIVATDDGTVSEATSMRGYGLTVVIDHGDGVESLYAHGSAIDVEEGDEVRAGERIARVGSTGRSTGPHLHFEIHVDGEPVDPMPYF